MFKVMLIAIPLVSLSMRANADHDGPAYGYHGHPAAGPYVGASLSRNEFDLDFGSGAQINTDDTGYRLFGGLAVSPYLRLEGGYIDFGEINGSESVHADGTTLGLEVAAPLGYDMSAFLRGGLLLWESELSTPGFSLFREGEDPYYGIGIRFWATPRLSIVGAFERFELANDHIDVSSLGFSVGF